VRELKRWLQDKEDVPVDQQRLLLYGKHLGDTKTLRESNISIGTVLHLVTSVQGGLSSAPFKFVDVSNSNAIEREEFSDLAPRYLPKILPPS
jgi:hypothetical protein